LNAFDLTGAEFHLISSLVYDKFGINLGEHKRSLVIERLQKVLRQGGFSSFTEYYYHVVEDVTGHALLTLIDRISTNHTFFFRESDHFDELTTRVIPETLSKQLPGRRSLRLWSAGCSSGEEPYTIAMIICNFMGQKMSALDAGVLATDISVTALEKASQGVYSDAEMTHVEPDVRRRYFMQLGEGRWSVKQCLKDLVLFRRLNLMRQSYPFKGKFHGIFCRNVMIYFDAPTRKALLERYHNYLEPGGYLFVGHSESLERSNGLFKYISPALYQKI
jgi:chemotaxis protein methyltransferase CheR